MSTTRPTFRCSTKAVAADGIGFTGGWNLRAIIPWLAGSLFGILAVDTSLYSGPLADLGHGIDTSLVGSALIAGIGYLVALRLWPEHVAPVDSSPSSA